jgi:hypothetical protein
MTYRLKPDDNPEPDIIIAPFTAKQVEALAQWQRYMEGGGARCPQHRDHALMAVTTDGLHCAADGCTYEQDWAYAFTALAKFCTKETPLPGADTKDYVVHVDAVNTDPTYDGVIIPYRCPNCGLTFDVDYR